MKKILYQKITFLSLATVAMLSSCLKDDAHYTNFAGSKLLVELPAATGVGPAGGFITPLAYPISSTPVAVNLQVNEAAPKPLSSALTVKVSVDAAALTAFNNATQTQYTADSTAAVTAGNAPPTKPPIYTLLPAEFYNSSFTTTIPANTNSSNIVINVTTANFDLSKAYVLPLTITDAGGQQISNYKTVFYNVQAKNAYDGIYTLTGYVHRDDDLTLGGPVKAGVTVAISTASANSVLYTQDWASGSAAGGINPITLNINPTTNAITASSSVNATLTTQLGYNSHYDPAKKTIYLAVIWNGTDPNHRSAIDTLVYKGSR